MKIYKLYLLYFLLEFVYSEKVCPCNKPSQCELIKTKQDKEVFVFLTSSDAKDWKNFNWNKLTTIVFFDFFDQNMYCFAHEKNVRVVYKANFDQEILLNITKQNNWINEQLKYAEDNFLDGINIDVEFELDKDNNTLSESLNKLMKTLSEMFHSKIPNSQVTFDVPWSPYNIEGNGVDNRNYDFATIAKYVDFMFIMSYDIQSQMLYGDNISNENECYARANSGFSDVAGGILGYLKMNITKDKLVLGQPWYGYDYKCIEYAQDYFRCFIDHVEFRGANCSDAAGKQITYNQIQNIVKYNNGKIYYDEHSSSPYVLYKDINNKTHQVWYDDDYSLFLKFSYIIEFGLRGVGIWNANCLNYSDTNQVNTMWNILPNYRKHV